MSDRVFTTRYETVASGFRLEYRIFAEHLCYARTVADFLQWRCPQLTLASTAPRVLLDGDVVEADSLLQPGQILSVQQDNHHEAPVNLSWQLVWQNDELMAVYKPPLLPVSRTTRNLHHTLISLVRRYTPYHDAHLLHRLDTETDGLLLIAKDKAADRKWKRQLDQLLQQKIYHAWVYGSPDWQEFDFSCELSEQTGSPIRCQMHVVDPQQPERYPKPKQSRTIFRVLRREGDRSLIECELRTGRKHQLRAQLAHLGYPIVADKIYAHQGRYYLQRLTLTQQGRTFSAEEIQALGGEHHRLTAVRLVIKPEPAEAPIVLAWSDFT